MAVLFGPGLGRQPAEGALLADTNPVDQAPIVVQAVDSQAGNLLEFRDPSGAVLSSVDITGAFGGAAGLAGAVILAPASAGRNTIQPAADADAGLILKTHSATQTAPLFQTQDSGGNVSVRLSPEAADSSIGAVDIDIIGDGSSGKPALKISAGATDAGGTTLASVLDKSGGRLIDLFSPGNGSILTARATVPGDTPLVANGGLNQTADLFQAIGAAPASPVVLWSIGTDASLVTQRTSTVSLRQITSIVSDYLDNTDATRKGRGRLYAADAASSTRQAVEWSTNGSSPTVGFLGASAVVRQTNGTAADLAAIADPAVKAFLTAISTGVVNLGLFAAPA